MKTATVIAAVALVLTVCTVSVQSFPSDWTTSCPFSGAHHRAGTQRPTPLPEDFGKQGDEPQWTYSSTPSSTPSSDPMGVMDSYFTAEYNANEAVLANITLSDGVVFVEQPWLILLTNTSRYNESIIPVIYTNLKEVCHLPLYTFVTIQGYTYTTNNTIDIPPSLMTTLKQIQSLGQAGYEVLGDYGFNSTQLERSVFIMNATLDFLSSVIESERVSYPQLINFTYTLADAVLLHAADAASASIVAIDKVMNKWRDTVLTPHQWEHFHVVIMSSHMPRRFDIYSQYFAAKTGFKLDDDGYTQGERLIFAENTPSEADALTLLAKHLTDFGTSWAFFRKIERMHEDLLAEGAHAYIDKFFNITYTSYGPSMEGPTSEKLIDVARNAANIGIN